MANIGTTNVPAISWGPLGPQAPSGPAILAGVQADYNVAFSVSFNWAGSTPQGQLASSQAATLNNYNQVMVYYASLVDPAFSQGRMQDAIARINFLTRNPPEATVLQVSCSGAGIVIPGGPTSYGTIKDAFGNLYQSHGGGHAARRRRQHHALLRVHGAGSGRGAEHRDDLPSHPRVGFRRRDFRRRRPERGIVAAVRTTSHPVGRGQRAQHERRHPRRGAFGHRGARRLRHR